MEPDHWVRDPELEEAGAWDVERAEVEWAETVPEQDLREIVCAPPAEQKSPIQPEHHVMI